MIKTFQHSKIDSHSRGDESRLSEALSLLAVNGWILFDEQFILSDDRLPPRMAHRLKICPKPC